MMIKECILYKTETTEDELGNVVESGKTELKTVFCRHTPWTNEEISLYGTTYTKDVQKFTLKTSYDSIDSADYAEIDGKMYEITEKSTLQNRWVCIQGKIYKE